MNTISTLSHLRRISLHTVVVAVCCITFLLPRFTEAMGVAPAILDLSLRAGEVTHQTVTVINTEDVPRTFQFIKENFSPSTEPGVALFDGGAKDAFPSWIQVNPTELLLSGESQQEVEVTVAVPQGAPSGDYYGVIFVAHSTPLHTNPRTAILLFLTVLGQSHFDANMTETSLHATLSSTRGNTLTVRVQNTGNVYIKPSGTVEVNPLLGAKITAPLNPETLRILVGESREWIVPWDESVEKKSFFGLLSEWRAFALGPVLVTTTLQVGEGDRVITKTEQDRFWSIPWRSGFLVLLLFLCVFFLVRLPRRYQ